MECLEIVDIVKYRSRNCASSTYSNWCALLKSTLGSVIQFTLWGKFITCSHWSAFKVFLFEECCLEYMNVTPALTFVHYEVCCIATDFITIYSHRVTPRVTCAPWQETKIGLGLWWGLWKGLGIQIKSVLMNSSKCHDTNTLLSNRMRWVWKTIIHLGFHAPVLRSNASYLSDPAPLNQFQIIFLPICIQNG